MKMLKYFRQFNRFCCLLEIDLQLGFSLVTFGVAGFFVIGEDALFGLWETVAYGAYALVTILWVILGYMGVREPLFSFYLFSFRAALRFFHSSKSQLSCTTRNSILLPCYLLQAKRESKGLMVVWLVFSIAEPAYIVYYFVTYFIDRNGIPTTYEDIVILMMVIGAVAFLLRLVLVIMSFRVMRNFGKGLKRRVFYKLTDNDVTERSPLNVDL